MRYMQNTVISFKLSDLKSQGLNEEMANCRCYTLHQICDSIQLYLKTWFYRFYRHTSTIHTLVITSLMITNPFHTPHLLKTKTVCREASILLLVWIFLVDVDGRLWSQLWDGTKLFDIRINYKYKIWWWIKIIHELFVSNNIIRL